MHTIIACISRLQTLVQCTQLSRSLFLGVTRYINSTSKCFRLWRWACWELSVSKGAIYKPRN
jgi:hypothetical protein